MIFDHVLRNSAGPALSVLALPFVGMLGGAVIVEQMFCSPASARSPSPRRSRATFPSSWD